MDEIWKKVERIIAVADLVEQRDPIRKKDVLKSLHEAADEIRNSAPSHPALRRLEDYTEEYEA